MTLFAWKNSNNQISFILYFSSDNSPNTFWTHSPAVIPQSPTWYETQHENE